MRSIFSEILNTSLQSWSERGTDQSVLSMALPVNGLDPLACLDTLSEDNQFKFLWDMSPGLCFAATGQCQNFEMVGHKRFDLAQRFSDFTLSKLVDCSIDVPSQAKPKVLFAFTFFEHPYQYIPENKSSPAVQAVLPKWQFTSSKGQGWLRLNSSVIDKSGVRDFVEQLWLMRENLMNLDTNNLLMTHKDEFSILNTSDWIKSFEVTLGKGIDLVSSGQLTKIVLAVKQSIELDKAISPTKLLFNLRRYQRGSCRFMWNRCKEESFFGASPERLISVRDDVLESDALAGTAKKGDNGCNLLKSLKDLREHQLVVTSISGKLRRHGLNPMFKDKPTIVKYGELIHLHTPIRSRVQKCSPLGLVNTLHPTPAVAGLPCKEAMNWIRTLESFNRNAYAAPIGWVDSEGDAEFRVAIRCGSACGKRLDLFAGAGIVDGSNVDDEIREVGLKLDVLATQLSTRGKEEISKKGF